MKKKDGSLRMCIHYCLSNKVTNNNMYPLSQIDELFDLLQEAHCFSHIELRLGYHKHRMRGEDIKKRTFLNRYGHYEYLVMSFGITNAPTTFIDHMNGVFRSNLD